MGWCCGRGEATGRGAGGRSEAATDARRMRQQRLGVMTVMGREGGKKRGWQGVKTADCEGWQCRLEGTWRRFRFRRIREKFFLGRGCPQFLKTLRHIMIIKLCHDGIKEF